MGRALGGVHPAGEVEDGVAGEGQGEGGGTARQEEDDRRYLQLLLVVWLEIWKGGVPAFALQAVLLGGCVARSARGAHLSRREGGFEIESGVVRKVNTQQHTGGASPGQSVNRTRDECPTEEAVVVTTIDVAPLLLVLCSRNSSRKAGHCSGSLSHPRRVYAFRCFSISKHDETITSSSSTSIDSRKLTNNNYSVFQLAERRE